MSPRIFVVGATGFVGGDLIAQLSSQHPEYEVSALVRTQAQASALQTKFPTIRTVIGTFESRDTPLQEAKDTDVIIQAADADNELVTYTLLEGAAKITTSPATYIHISGQANLINLAYPLGKPQDKIYGDIDNAKDILSLPPHHIHAAVEQAIIAKAESLNIRTAIVSLRLMYGLSRGLSPQNPNFKYYIDAVLAHGRPFVVEKGENIQTHSHIHDVSSAIETVVVEALEGVDGNATWGRDGYYVVESLEETFLGNAQTVGEVLVKHGLINSKNTDHLPAQQVAGFWGPGQFVWGASMRSKTQRLQSLGWRPVSTTREEDLRAMTEYEVQVRRTALR